MTQLPRGVKDIHSRTFGFLTVSSFEGVRKRVAWWSCVCECGGNKTVCTKDLTLGRVQSCGCYRPNRRPSGEAAFDDLYRRYQSDAKRHERLFKLDKGTFRELVSQHCTYCGSPPNQGAEYKKVTNGKFIFNGLDRVDNELGYTEGNVVPCCELCNKAKYKMSRDEFLTWVKRVYKHIFGEHYQEV